MTFDLALTGGRVVAADAVHDADVGILAGTIARLAPRGSLGPAARTIDASGLLVLPGGIDPHIHSQPTGLAQPGATPVPSDAPRMSAAAILGGTTTVMDFAPSEQGVPLMRSLEAKRELWRGAYCDHAFHVMLRGKLSPEALGEIEGVVAAGHPSFKIFTTDGVPRRKGLLRVGGGDIWEVLRRLARACGILTVHGEDDDLVMHQYEVLQREGRLGLENMPQVHSALAEELAFRHTIALARRVEGAALYLMHVTSRSGVDAIAEARAAGAAVYGEALQNYLVFDQSRYSRPDGVLFHTYPSLRTPDDRDALASALADGTLSAVSTDAGVSPRATKTEFSTVDGARGGHAGIETRLGVAYTELVHKRGLPLARFAALTATNAARLFGLYPAKGVIAVGSDADVVLFDPSVRRTLRAAELRETDYSVWDGYEVRGWPVTTVLRGTVVADRGRLVGRPGAGRPITGRRIDARIAAGPAL